MPVSKKIKLRGQGGPGRGQGNKRIKNKRVKASPNIPPDMLEEIKVIQKNITGDTLSSTIVWVLGYGLREIRKIYKFD